MSADRKNQLNILNQELRATMNQYQDRAKTAIKKYVAVRMIPELKSRSPKAKDMPREFMFVSGKKKPYKSYFDGWASKENEKGATVYNKNRPDLTNLLENGFERQYKITSTRTSAKTQQKFGKHRNEPARPHIRPVVETARAELVDFIIKEMGE